MLETSPSMTIGGQEYKLLFSLNVIDKMSIKYKDVPFKVKDKETGEITEVTASGIDIMEYIENDIKFTIPFIRWLITELINQGITAENYLNRNDSTYLKKELLHEDIVGLFMNFASMGNMKNIAFDAMIAGSAVEGGNLKNG